MGYGHEHINYAVKSRCYFHDEEILYKRLFHLDTKNYRARADLRQDKHVETLWNMPVNIKQWKINLSFTRKLNFSERDRYLSNVHVNRNNCYGQSISNAIHRLCQVFVFRRSVFVQFWLFCLWKTSTLTVSVLSLKAFSYLCIVTAHLHCNKNVLVMKLSLSI